MSSRTCTQLALLAALAAGALPATAANMGFMADSAMAYFNEADLKLFNTAFEEALNKAAVGETRAWANDKTKSSGQIKVADTFERDGLSCRTLAVLNKAKSTSNTGQYRFCKQSSGKWALVQ